MYEYIVMHANYDELTQCHLSLRLINFFQIMQQSLEKQSQRSIWIDWSHFNNFMFNSIAFIRIKFHIFRFEWFFDDHKISFIWTMVITLFCHKTLMNEYQLACNYYNTALIWHNFTTWIAINAQRMIISGALSTNFYIWIQIESRKIVFSLIWADHSFMIVQSRFTVTIKPNWQK